MTGPVTVAICTRDRPDRLEGCLEAVAAVLRPDDQLLVVDSASGPTTGAVARSAGVDVLRLERPGLSRARNAALDAARHDLLAFTDDDCRPAPGWPAALAEGFGDEAIGFVTGRVIGAGPGVPLAVKVDEQPLLLDRTVPMQALGHGANVAVRRPAALAVGGFDELLGAGSRFRAGEDTDMFRRLLDAGWLGRYLPAATVTHLQWRNHSQALRASYGYGMGYGAMSAKARGSARAALLRRGLGAAGLGQAGRDLRAGYPYGAVVCLCWAAGVARGHVAARRLDVVDGLLRSGQTLR
jgi:glycosyltransferase involved in cell wall biosynthesis